MARARAAARAPSTTVSGTSSGWLALEVTLATTRNLHDCVSRITEHSLHLRDHRVAKQVVRTKNTESILSRVAKEANGVKVLNAFGLLLVVIFVSSLAIHIKDSYDLSMMLLQFLVGSNLTGRGFLLSVIVIVARMVTVREFAVRVFTMRGFVREVFTRKVLRGRVFSGSVFARKVVARRVFGGGVFAREIFAVGVLIFLAGGCSAVGVATGTFFRRSNPLHSDIAIAIAILRRVSQSLNKAGMGRRSYPWEES